MWYNTRKDKSKETQNTIQKWTQVFLDIQHVINSVTCLNQWRKITTCAIWLATETNSNKSWIPISVTTSK